MKPHDSIQVVRKLRDIRAYPILRCLDVLEGLNNGYLPSGNGPRVHELANSMRLGTVPEFISWLNNGYLPSRHGPILSQDLSGAWVTVRGER
jgi:hypothetical protein